MYLQAVHRFIYITNVWYVTRIFNRTRLPTRCILDYRTKPTSVYILNKVWVYDSQTSKHPPNDITYVNTVRGTNQYYS